MTNRSLRSSMCDIDTSYSPKIVTSSIVKSPAAKYISFEKAIKLLEKRYGCKIKNEVMPAVSKLGNHYFVSAFFMEDNTPIAKFVYTIKINEEYAVLLVSLRERIKKQESMQFREPELCDNDEVIESELFI